MIVREIVTRLRYSTDNRGFNEAERQFNALHSAALQLAGVVTGMMGGAGLVRMSDEWKGVNNQLRSVLDTQQEVAMAQEEIFRAAQASRAEYEATGELFTSIHRGADQYNLSIRESIRLTETISKLMQMGRGGEGANAALIQFTQSISSGEFRGEELRSALEQAAPLANAVAEVMGVTTNRLLEMGAAGQLKIGPILQGLLRMSEDVDERFSRLQWKFAQGWTYSRNALMKYVNELDKASGVSNWLINKMVNGTDRLIAYLRRMVQWGQEAFGWLEVQLDGTEQAVKAVKMAVMALAAPAVIGAVRSLAGWIWRALLPFTLITGAILGVSLVIEDLWAWVQGHDSLLGQFFGDFDSAEVQAALEPFKQQFDSILESVSGIGAGLEELGEIIVSHPFTQWLKDVGALEIATLQFGSMVGNVFEQSLGIIGAFAANLNDVVKAFSALLEGDFSSAAMLLGGQATRTWKALIPGLDEAMKGVSNHFANIEKTPGYLAARNGGVNYSVHFEQNGFTFNGASGSPGQNAAAVERAAGRAFGPAGIPYRQLGSIERAP